MVYNLYMGVWGFPVGLTLNWRVPGDSLGSQYYWDGNQGFWKGQIAVLNGPYVAKDLFTVLKVLDRQGGSECPWVVEGHGVLSPILGIDGS